jgi:hypothetical protein
VFFDLIAFYGTGHLDGTAKQQEFFRQCGFTGIGVRNDRKSSPFLDLTIVFHAAAKLNENSHPAHHALTMLFFRLSIPHFLPIFEAIYLRL